MPPPASSTTLIELIRKSGLMDAEQVAAMQEKVGELPADATKAAALFVKNGFMTPFQAKLLLTGRYRGFRLGSYIIRDQIGQGGMGAVYLAEHQTLRRPVAVKVLAPAAGGNKLAVERFLREARAAAALDHPNIVRLFDVGKEGDLHYLVMEYVDGQTLDKLLDHRGTISAGKAVEYITQAAAGLQHAYEKGFIHRDIKPGNLILAKDGTVKILDMGLARSSDGGEKLTEVLDQGAVVGTADYISPEQAMNTGQLDIRSDIYSLGATMFTLITGRTLYEGNTTQKLLQHQMKAPPSLATIDKTLPPGLAQVVGRMLAKNPADRPQTPADVIAELVPWLPSSHQVVAAISRTNLNSSKSLRTSLEKAVSKSTDDLQLPDVEATDDDSPDETPKPKKPASKLPLILGLVVIGVVLLLGVGGTLIAYAMGLFTSPPNLATNPAPTNQPPTNLSLATEATSSRGSPATTTPTTPATTTPATTKQPDPPKPVTGVSYELDLTAAKPYTEKGSISVPDPMKPTFKIWKTKMKAGSGSLPAGWAPRADKPDTEAEFVVDTFDGSVAMGLRNLSGSPTASLASPDLVIPTNTMTLTIEYQTEGDVGECELKYLPILPADPVYVSVAKLPASKGKWTVKELPLTLNGPNGLFELCNTSPTGTLWIKGFQLRQMNYTPSEKVLWQMNLSRQQPFIQRSASDPGAQVPVKILSESGPGKMPAGWYRWVEFANAEVEFFADGPPGKMAFGVRNMKGDPGVMATLPEFKFPTGKATVRVVYQTAGSGSILRLRPTTPKRLPSIDVVKFAATGTSWKAVIVELDGRGSTSGLFELYNTSAGADGAIRIRELYVLEKADTGAE